MPNVTSVLNDHIRRLAGREIRANTKKVKKASAHYRRDIAALKRTVAALKQSLASLQKVVQQHQERIPEAKVEDIRFRADGLKTHRAKLGLSGDDYGRLVGVSGLSIYNWEGRKAKPRQAQVLKLAAVRKLGKREALQRLGTAEKKPKAAIVTKAGRPRKRGKFKHTGAQSILGLLKGRKALTTREINFAWKKEGRGGTADVMLGLMVKAKKLKRTKLKGQRGSQYLVR